MITIDTGLFIGILFITFLGGGVLCLVGLNIIEKMQKRGG